MRNASIAFRYVGNSDAHRGQVDHGSIVMKDTTSFFGEPARATRWATMARRIAEEEAARG